MSSDSPPTSEVVIITNANNARLPNSYDGIHEIQWYGHLSNPPGMPGITYYTGTLHELQPIDCPLPSVAVAGSKFYLSEVIEGDGLSNTITYWACGNTDGLQRYRWKAYPENGVTIVEDDTSSQADDQPTEDHQSADEVSSDDENQYDYDEDYYERAYRALTGNVPW